MMENMGDAHECVEQLLWLVERGIGRKTATELIETEWYPMVRGERKEDAAFKYVEKQMSK